jgi:hypothetical protein
LSAGGGRRAAEIRTGRRHDERNTERWSTLDELEREAPRRAWAKRRTMEEAAIPTSSSSSSQAR